MIKDRRRILFIGDTHIGSIYAPWPEDFVTRHGNRITQNNAQKSLSDSFNALRKEHLVTTADTVILMGDLCQGNNRKRFGAETISAELVDQVNAAVHFLSPLCRGKNVFGVIGTGYHDSLDVHLDALVIQRLGGFCLGKIKLLQIRESGHKIIVTHGSGSGAFYTGAQADKTAQTLLLGAGRKKIEGVDLWVQGHLHHFWYHTSDQISFVQTPCFQSWYYLESIASDYGKKQPDIGAVVIDFEEGRRPVVHPLLYPLPRLHDSKVII